MSAVPDSVCVQAEDFDVAAEYAALRGDPQTGAIALFVGLVRDFGDMTQVQDMFLEHYPGMTEKALAGIIREARQRWPVGVVRVVHRVGLLRPTDQIVLVGVTSAHREAAFAACEFVMDYLKTRAPFWKRETMAGGESRWVDQKAADVDREARWQQGAPAPLPQAPGTPRG